LVSLACIPAALITGSESVAGGGDIIAVSLVGLIVGQALLFLTRGAQRPLSLISIFTYCHVALFVIRPWYSLVEQSGTNIFTGERYGPPELAAAAVAATGYVAVCFGYVLSWRRSDEDLKYLPREQFVPPNHVALERWMVIVAGVGFGLYAVYIASVGPARYFGELLGGRTEERSASIQGTSAYLYAGIQIAFGALLMLVILNLATRHRGRAAVYIVLLALAAFPSVASGSRASFLPVAVAILIVLSVLTPGILRLRAVVLWLPAVVFFGFIAPRVWRDTLAQGQTLSQSLVAAASPENSLAGFFGGLDTAMIDAFAVQVSAQLSGSLQFLAGQSYLAFLGAPVPRSIWPDKPEPVDKVLNGVLFPSTDARGIGFSFGLYSEPYFNFGIVGVVIVMLLLGVALGVLQSGFERRPSATSLLLVAMVGGYLFPLARGSLTFDAQRLLIPLVPVLLGIWLAGRARRVRLSRPGQVQEIASLTKGSASVG